MTSRDITGDDVYTDVILSEALPYLPIHMESPDYSCSAFGITDVNGDVLMLDSAPCVRTAASRISSPPSPCAWCSTAQQLPNPEKLTSNTQWSVVYNNTKLTAEITLRRKWGEITRYSLADNQVTGTPRAFTFADNNARPPKEALRKEVPPSSVAYSYPVLEKYMGKVLTLQ